MLMKNNFLSKVTKMPQNTGGGNSQTKRATLALPLRYLCAMLLALFMGIGNVWAANVVVTFKGATTQDAKSTALTPTISSSDANITVGACASTCSQSGYLISTADGKTAVLGSTTYYLAQPYQSGSKKYWKDAGSNFYGTFTIPSGYTYTIKGVNHALAAVSSSNFSATITVKDATTTKYSTGSLSVASKSSGASITSTAINIAEANWVVLSAGTYTINVTPANTADASTGKYFGMAEVALIGDLAAAGGDPVCPSGISITGEDEYTEGETISLTATKTAGNGEITYTWYRGADLATAKAAGALGTGATYTKSNCVTGDAGKYFCEATKTSCSAAASTGFDVSVDANPVCFNMPAIASKPSNLAAVSVEGGTLADASVNDKTVSMDGNGLKLGGNDSRLKVTLTGASITEGTKITVAYKGASTDGSGIGIFDGNCANQTLDATGLKNAGSVSHTFTAVEAANYADEFIINRNGTGKSICVNAITVEDCGPAVTKHTITLNYNDGETANGSLTVVDGRAAAKPADPTRGKYTFLGWFVGDTDNEYVWSTAVTDDITLKAHWQNPWTLTFDADGGSAVADVTVKHNTKAEKPTDPTKDDNDFLGWFYGDPAVEFDWDANVTQDYALVAHWQPAVAKYDVEYYDGETKIGTEEQVWATAHPTAAGIETAKPLYTFVGWYLTSALEGDPVALNTVTPVEGLKLYGKWNKAYATSYDMEAYAVSDGATLETLLSNLDAAGYAYTNVNDIDNGHTHNYIYDGMKYKTNDGDLSFNVNAGKLVIVKTGNLPANALTMYINGVADPTVFVGANEAVETHVNNYFYSEAEALYRLDIQASKGTCAIKAVTITDPFTVSFDANGGDDVASLNGTPSVTLPSASKGTESFLGWFDGETKVGEAGEKYTPTANITLKAHWEAVSTDARLSAITFSSDAGTLSPAFDPEVTSYTYTMPYGTAAVPTITGATSVSAKAQEPQIVSQASAWGETAVIRGVAESSDTKAYNITMLRAPKDGVCLVWADIPSNSTITYNATKSKYFAESDVTLATTVNGKDGSAPSGVKFQGSTYIHIGGAFLAGDVLALDVTYAANGTNQTMYVYDAQAGAEENIIGTLAGGKTPAGLNEVTLTKDAADLWLVRGGQNSDWNPHVDYVAVYRAMNPVLTAITINDRDGVIDPLDDKHFTVTIPNDANLASLTIVPTIVRNAPHATTPEQVMTNEGAWVLTEDGNNTYRIMDKDGDYTDYTITLIRDVLKYQVSFDTDGGSSIDPVEVVANGYLTAGQVPADPTKAENVFLGWAETAGGDVVADITAIQITGDKTFFAKWEAEPEGIKLIDKSTGAINTTNFITGVTATETNSEKAAAWGNTQGTFAGINNLTKIVQYNATKTQLKVKVKLYNTNNSDKEVYLHKILEGQTTSTPEVITATSKTVVETSYTFDASENRSIYLATNSTDVKILQVKIIESGEDLPMFGQAGYELNLNKGRVLAPKDADMNFEGMAYQISSAYAVLSSTEFKVKSATGNPYKMTFTVASPVTMNIKESGANYYVYKVAEPEDKGTANSGDKSFDLTAGTWRIESATTSEAKFTKIEFIAPKCEQPQFNALANSDICSGDPYVALDGTGTVTDGGTITYKWYAEGGTDVLGTDATYMPAEDGRYYVVALHHVDGYTDNEATSDVVTVTTHTGTAISEGLVNQRGVVDAVVTLTVTASGKNLHYTWKECATIDGTYTDVAGAADAASLNVTITEGLSKYYKVIVHSDCGADQESIAKVEQFVAVSQQDVTGSIVWDWTEAASVNEIKLSSSTTPKKNEGFVMANGAATVYNNANFESDKLYLEGEYIIRTEGGKLFQGQTIKFNTTVAGAVRVTFSHTGSNKPARELFINGVGTGTSVTGTSQTKTGLIEVPAGEVAITAFHVNPTDGAGQQYVRVYKIEFYAYDTERADSWIAPGELGTICYPNGHVFTGAEVYEMAGVDENNKFVFDQVEQTEPGKPYLFVATSYEPIKLYKTTAAAELSPIAHKGMIGTFVSIDLDYTDERAAKWYYFSGKKFYAVSKRTSDLNVPANRAYVDMNTPVLAGAPRHGVRRITFDVQGTNIATGIENAAATDKPAKMLINGQLFILRGEKMYDAKGQLVK